MNISIKRIVLLLLTTTLMGSCSDIKVSDSESIGDNSASSDKQVTSEDASNSTSTSTSISSYSSVNTNPHDCQNHQLSETVVKEATLIEKGIKNYKCPNCGADFDDSYYKMDEFVFENTTFMDDGQEHKILINGVLPYGVTVKYENNTLKGIGSKEATAKFFDEHNNQILEKKATLNIFENTGLPNIRVVTTDGEDPDWHNVNGERPYKSMTVSIDNCEDAYVKSNVPGEIKVRGNSTNQEKVTKRAFRLKLSGKTNLLGLNDGLKEKSWVLLADFFDQSMFRNQSAFTIGNSLFNYSGYYSSDYKHVILYMNGENRGVYLLAEQQQAKKGRIPINEADDGVTTTKTGYLLEIDGLVSQQGHVDSQTHIGTLEGDPCFTTGTGSGGGFGWGWGGQGGDSINGVNIQDKGYVVKTDTYGEEQVPFIRDYLNNVLKAFKGTLKGEKKQIVNDEGELVDSPYETQYETLNAYLDIDSFFRMYLLQEYLKNFDVGWGSFYMYIDFSANSKVKRLTLAAPWDFDLGEGNKTSGNIVKTNDNFLNSKDYATGMTTSNPWLYMLSQTDFFNDMFKKYYSIFDSSDIYTRMMDNIQYERMAFMDDFAMTYQKYDLKNAPDCNMSTRKYSKHDDAVDYLVNWFTERKAFLDQTWGK